MAVGDKFFAVMKNELAVSNGVATLGPDGLLNASQRPITDSMPTQGSSNPVQSGGVYSALSNKVNLPISIPAAADLNEYTIPGMYFCAENGSTVKNTPAPADSFSLFVEKTGAWGTGIKQTFTHFATGETCQRVFGYDTSGTKGPWVPLATATPPQRYVLQLTDGWVRVNAAEYWRTQEGLVVVTFRIARSGGAEIHAELYPVAILPEGFRPVGYAAHAAASTMTAVPAVVWVGDDGVIYASAAQDVPGSSDPAPGDWPGFVATLVFTAS